MKRKALEAIVEKHVNGMEKYSNRLPGSFDQEDLHDLRVGFKKTRAFVRLLQLEKDGGRLHIPDQLKAIYQSCGKVRDLQLFLAELHTIGIATKVPVALTRWRQQLFTSKEETVKAVEAASFKKTGSAITKVLPRQLQEGTLKQFMQRKVAAIHIILLAADNEEDLHSVRKQVKDIGYNIRTVEQEGGMPFPPGDWKSEAELNELASKLGDFNDRCGALTLLQEGYTHAGNEEEKAILHELYTNRLQEKEEEEKLLVSKLLSL